MSDLPLELKYSKSHEWIRDLGDDMAVIGITQHAQELLGDLVYVELPQLNRTVRAGDECAVVESVKAASDIYSPVSGEIIAINEQLKDSPEIVNQSPYKEGWLFKLRFTDKGEFQQLLDASAYKATLD
jgi:glycine cleavage system H protein